MIVSVAVPFFNEAACCENLFKRLMQITAQLPEQTFEYVFINDGSTDKTSEILDEFCALNDNASAIHLSRNFGQQAALSAAIDYAKGDVLIFLDADLQDPPELIPQFIELFNKGYDVVYAKRAERDSSLLMKLLYFSFYRVLRLFASIEIPPDTGDFALLSRRVVNLIREAPERNRFLRGLRAWVGFRQIGIPVARPERAAGDSKYSLKKLLRLAGDGIFAFSTAPLRLMAVLGAITILLSAIFALYSVVVKFSTGDTPSGFTAIILFILFTSGVQLICLGLLGEYVGRIYEETKRRPLYVIDRITKKSQNG